MNILKLIQINQLKYRTKETKQKNFSFWKFSDNFKLKKLLKKKKNKTKKIFIWFDIKI